MQYLQSSTPPIYWHRHRHNAKIFIIFLTRLGAVHMQISFDPPPLPLGLLAQAVGLSSSAVSRTNSRYNQGKKCLQLRICNVLPPYISDSSENWGGVDRHTEAHTWKHLSRHESCNLLNEWSSPCFHHKHIMIGKGGGRRERESCHALNWQMYMFTVSDRWFVCFNF